MHPRLTGVLRTINPLIPSGITPREAWPMIKPEGAAYLRNSFWQVLQSRLQFAQSSEKQIKVAEWIWQQKERAQKAGQSWPPKPIIIKPALVPQPHTF